MPTPADRRVPEPDGKQGNDYTPDHSAHRAAAEAQDPAAVDLRLARFMFDLQADDYDADDAMRELAWADDGIRGFWLGQAGSVVSFLGLEACA